MGPVANDRRLAAMDVLIADAKAKGARLVAGGSRIGNRGYFHELTVLADVPDNAQAMNEEPFGLAAYAWTKSAKTANAIANAVETGMISINNTGLGIPEVPFGGVKDSGYGREGGTEGLECYTVAKNVSHLVL